MVIRRFAGGLGEKIVAQPDKDDFNLDDFQYSGVKLTPLPNFNQDAPAAAIAAPISEEASPLEPADKKSKKKAKKEKPAKVKKVKVAAYASGDEKQQSAFLKQLSEASPYTVLLGMTFLALLLAVIFLFIELSRYELNIHPPKSQVSAIMNEAVPVPFDVSGMAEINNGPCRCSDWA